MSAEHNELNARPRPYRLVDRSVAGWYLVAGGRYETPRESVSWTYERIAIERGPVREVVAPTEAEVLLVEAALERAHRRAAGSLAVALHRVGVAYGASEPLVAGQPESWESEVIKWIAFDFGARLAKQPNRWDEDVVHVLSEVIGHWTAPDSPVYTEVAGNLAFAFSVVAQAAGGWEKVSDELMEPAWRRSGRHTAENRNTVGVLRNFLLSKADAQ